jgi:RNA polymerase primary sigma factor
MGPDFENFPAELRLAQVIVVRSAGRAVGSIDAPVSSEGAISLGELFAAAGPSIEDEADATFRADAVRRAVAKLPAREHDVILLRFGLDDRGESSLEGIGERLGTSRECVRQIDNAALHYLERDSDLKAVASSGAVKRIAGASLAIAP